MKRRMAWLLVLALLAACDDPSRVVEPVRALSVLMVIDPDAPQQLLAVSGAQGEAVPQPRAELLVGDQVLSRALAVGSAACESLYGGAPRACLVFRFDADAATYTVRVSADGYPTATAEVMVPGPFAIETAAAAGTPPGTQGLSASWSESSGAFRYVVALRSDSLRACWVRGACERGGGWMATTRETSLSAVVPADALSGGTGGWWLDVYAMDATLFDHLTTGTGADPFPVPPVQNVSGGYGAVGAWVRRSARLP